MSDGIQIPAGVVRLALVALAAAMAWVIYQELPAARRYLKMESYSYRPG